MVMPRRSVLQGLAAAGLVSACDLYAGKKPTFDERYRPRYHFTPARNWMNDPNGLVFYEGEYHLFFQYNPKGKTWGHLSWGHAVSTDLLNWRELEVAIPERDVMIFSGSAVVDYRNSAGLSANGAPALVAIYTSFHPRSYAEAQNLAYSLDRGRTWSEYRRNPVLKYPESGAFRDPKVFWYAATRRWVMSVVRSEERVVLFYASEDLLSWHEISRFGPAGAVGGPWEVPELIEVQVDGGGTRWVLIVGVTGNAGPTGGSGVQYFVGDFDGHRFVPEARARVGAARWVDFGADFYASQTWANIPAEDGRRVWIAWMSNTRYANETPTDPWRGMLTIPRTLHLAREPGGHVLIQRPVRELAALRREETVAGPFTIDDGSIDLPGLMSLGDACEFKLSLNVDGAQSAGLVLHFGDDAEVRIGYDARIGHVFVDRRRDGDFNAAGYRGRHYAPVSNEGKQIDLHIFLDRSSVEIFADGGRSVISDLLFPKATLSRVSFYAEGGAAELRQIQAWRLAPAGQA